MQVAGSGPPVVCVHGFGASGVLSVKPWPLPMQPQACADFSTPGAHWRKTMPALAQDRTVLALDLLGFGRSDKPLVAYSIDLWKCAPGAVSPHCLNLSPKCERLSRECVRDFVKEVAGPSAVLIGNSIGSLVCLAVRARHRCC